MLTSNDFDDVLPEPEDLTPLARTRRRKAFWASVFREAETKLDLSQMESWHSYRIVVAYRIIREIARIKQAVFDNEALAELLDNEDFFGWTEPICEGEFAIRTGAAYLKKIRSFDIPLLPPLPGTEHEERLGDYFQAVTMIADRLHILISEDGRKGFMGLTDLARYQDMWPTLEEILAYENSLLHAVLAQISEDGTLVARQEIRVRYSLRRWEEDSLFAVTTQGAVELLSGTVEEDRAVMALRLENFVHRTREGDGDLRAELAALKLISDIQNLRKAKSADEASEMVDVVRAEVKKIEKIEKIEERKAE